MSGRTLTATGKGTNSLVVDSGKRDMKGESSEHNINNDVLSNLKFGVNLKPNCKLGSIYGVDLDTAEYIYKKGYVDEEVSIAFSDGDIPITMEVVKAILGKKKCDSLEFAKKKLAKDRQDKKLAHKEDLRQFRKEKIVRTKEKQSKPEFENNYGYLEFLSYKSRFGNYRSASIHPHKVYGTQIKQRRTMKSIAGLCEDMSDFAVTESMIDRLGKFAKDFWSKEPDLHLEMSAMLGQGMDRHMSEALDDVSLFSLFDFDSISALVDKASPLFNDIKVLFQKLNGMRSNFFSGGVFSVVSHALILVYSLCVNQDKLKNILDIYSFFRCIGVDASKLLKAIKIFDFSSEKCIVNTESALTTVEGIYCFLNSVLSSKFVQSITKLLLVAVSFKVFDKDWTKGIFKTIGYEKPMSIIESFHSIVAAIMNFLKIGELLNDGVPFVTALLSKDPLDQLVEDSLDILRWKDFLYSGLPIKDRMDRAVFLGKVIELTRAAEGVVARTPKSDKQKRLKEVIVSLKLAYMNNVQESQRNNRMAPIGILLDGDPGIGKSFLTEYVMKIYALVKGRDFDYLQVFTRNPTTDYFEGCDSLAQDILHYSELGNTALELVKLTGEKLVLEVTTLMDRIPFLLDMAFDLKGKNYANFGLLVIDTNNPGLNAKYTISNVEALWRRFLRITPVVQQDFKKGSSNQIDSVKSMSSDNDFLDKYWFKIETRVALSPTKGQVVPFMSKSGSLVFNIYEMTEFLVEYMTKHINEQQALQNLKGPDMEPQFYLDKIKSNTDPYTLADLLTHSLVEEEKELPADVIESEKFFPGVVFVNGVREEPINTEAKFQDLVDAVLKKKEKKEESPLKEVDFRKPHLDLEDDPRERLSALYDLVYTGSSHILTVVTSVFVDQSLSASAYIDSYGFNTQRKVVSTLSSLGLILGYASGLAFIWMVLLAGLYAVSQQVGIIPKFAIERFNTNQRLESKNRMFKAYSDFKRKCNFKVDDKMLFSGWWYDNVDRIILFLGVLSSAVIVYKAVGSLSKKKTIKDLYTEKSDFKMDSSYNDELNALEDTHHMSKSYTRVPVKGTKLWNTKIPGSISLHKGSPDSLELSRTLVNNLRVATIRTSLGPCATHVFGVEGAYALVNRHAFSEFPVEVAVSTTGSVYQSDNTVWRVTLVQKDDLVTVHDDIALVRLNGIQFIDALPHISVDKQYSEVNVGRICKTSVQAMYMNSPLRMYDDVVGDIVLSDHWVYGLKEHAEGMCGSPLVIQKDVGSCIVAIHCAGMVGEINAYGCPITRSQVEKALFQIKSQDIYMSIHSQGNLLPYELVEPHVRSPFRFEVLHGLDYYGRFPGDVNMKNKSKVKTTPFRKKIEELFSQDLNFKGDKVYGPPMMMAGKDKNGDYLSPYNVALKKMSLEKKPLDKRIMKRVIDEITQNILESFGGVSLSPLDVETAINGVSCDPFTRRVNTSTSAGFGWNTMKSALLPIVYDTEGIVIREPISKLKSTLVGMMKIYDVNACVHDIANASLKDEPREREKIELGKTRLFYIPSIQKLILGKMFLGPFYTHLMENGYKGFSSVGINILTGADTLVRELTNFSPHIMEGDYGNFDLTVPFDVRLASNTIKVNVLRACGYTEENLRVVKGLLTDSLFPLINLNNDVFCSPGQVLSGDVATADENTLLGEILLMYAWYTIIEENFTENVEERLYGDDMLAAINARFKELFNNEIYRDLCWDLYGMTYTSAEKGDKLDKFITWDKMSFLKRNFRWSEEFERYIAPLKMDSIYRSLTVYIPSSSVSPSDQFEGTFQSALMELFFHLDVDMYNGFREKLIGIYCDFFCFERKVIEKRFKTRSQLIEDLGF